MGHSPLFKAPKVEETMSSELLKLKVTQMQSLDKQKMKNKDFNKITLKKINPEVEEAKQPLNAYFPPSNPTESSKTGMIKNVRSSIDSNSKNSSQPVNDLVPGTIKKQ